MKYTTQQIEELTEQLNTGDSDLDMIAEDYIWLAQQNIDAATIKVLAERAAGTDSQWPLLTFAMLVRTHLEASN